LNETNGDTLEANQTDPERLQCFLSVASRASSDHLSYRRDLPALLDLSMTVQEHDLALDLGKFTGRVSTKHLTFSIAHHTLMNSGRDSGEETTAAERKNTASGVVVFKKNRNDCAFNGQGVREAGCGLPNSEKGATTFPADVNKRIQTLQRVNSSRRGALRILARVGTNRLSDSQSDWFSQQANNWF
jgi:hypothetical protein